MAFDAGRSHDEVQRNTGAAIRAMQSLLGEPMSPDDESFCNSAARWAAEQTRIEAADAVQAVNATKAMDDADNAMKADKAVHDAAAKQARPQTKVAAKQPLVIDVEHTLLHTVVVPAAANAAEAAPDVVWMSSGSSGKQAWTFLRPFVRAFLAGLAPFYAIHLVGHSAAYLADMRRLLDPKGTVIASVRAVPASDRRLCDLGMDPRLTVILDDRPESWAPADRAGVLAVPPFIAGDASDAALRDVAWLRLLHTHETHKTRAASARVSYGREGGQGGQGGGQIVGAFIVPDDDEEVIDVRTALREVQFKAAVMYRASEPLRAELMDGAATSFARANMAVVRKKTKKAQAKDRGRAAAARSVEVMAARRRAVSTVSVTAR